MEFLEITEEAIIVDLTEDNDNEENIEIKREEKETIKSSENTSDVTANVEDAVEKKKFTQVQEESGGEESNETQELSSRLSIRNVDKNLELAVEEIIKGGSLSMVASYYGLSEDLIYQSIVSRNVTHEMDVLTRSEEISLVKWILRSSKNNSLVMRQHLLEKVGRMKKVVRITPIFAKSKFGRKWYEYFLRSNPEINEVEGVLLPSLHQKEDPEDLVKLYGLKQAKVVLYDFKKQPNFFSALNCKVSLPAYLREDFYTDKIKSEVSKDCLSENRFGQLLEKKKHVSMEVKRGSRRIPKNSSSVAEEKTGPNFHAFAEVKYTPSLVDFADVKNSLSDNETSTSDISESGSLDCIATKMSETVKSSRKKGNKHKAEDSKPTCKKCGKTFFNKAKLERHMSTHVPKELYTESCWICLKQFASKYRFLVHLRNTHGDISHVCSDCNRVFKHQTSLRKHFKQVHCVNEKPDNSRVFICDICRKPFKYKNSLEDHIMYGHLKENKRYPCNICNKTFIKHSLMLRHKTRHSKIKPHVCVMCSKSFSRKYLLTRHMEKCEKQKRGDDTIDDCKRLCQEFIEEMELD